MYLAKVIHKLHLLFGAWQLKFSWFIKQLPAAAMKCINEITDTELQIVKPKLQAMRG